MRKRAGSYRVVSRNLQEPLRKQTIKRQLQQNAKAFKETANSKITKYVSKS